MQEKKMKLIFLFLIVVIILSGCVQTVQTTDKDRAITACVDLCKSSKENLSNGPCLSNEIIPNWVCDVAHSPRQAVDNLAENQCSAYREGLAKHFVEVDTNCNLITAV